MFRVRVPCLTENQMEVKNVMEPGGLWRGLQGFGFPKTITGILLGVSTKGT